MKIFFRYLFLFVICLTSCQTIPPVTSDTEGHIRSHLIGTWHSYHTYYGESLQMEKTFHADGSASGIIRPRLSDGSVSLYLPWVSFRSRWKLEGRTLTVYDMNSSDGLLDPEEVHMDTILDISEEYIHYLDEPTGDKFFYYKGRLK